MLAWAFPCKTSDEVSALLRALGKHRYLREADHRLHWMLDAALASEEPFAAHARAFEWEPEQELDWAAMKEFLQRSWQPRNPSRIRLACQSLVEFLDSELERTG